MVKSGLNIIFLIRCKELLITRVAFTNPFFSKEIIIHAFKVGILFGYKGLERIRNVQGAPPLPGMVHNNSQVGLYLR